MVARQSFYIDAPVETVFEYFKDPNLRARPRGMTCTR